MGQDKRKITRQDPSNKWQSTRQGEGAVLLLREREGIRMIAEQPVRCLTVFTCYFFLVPPVCFLFIIDKLVNYLITESKKYSDKQFKSFFSLAGSSFGSAQ